MRRENGREMAANSQIDVNVSWAETIDNSHCSPRISRISQRCSFTRVSHQKNEAVIEQAFGTAADTDENSTVETSAES